ncbi:hypothetical protein EGR_10478 [Echinococcus granulosus]|uniref:Uncharacterized protein n=1 Tax=Echinococcus granulosus TaxID=6210 RepID=W6U0L5_ECHGR|nr:hypothetical protein EGR_10478 [Echinococcus granulosus]EUB54660.1 hypothetical protein EGR_10478 [Echinococcus granulosus]
MVQGRICRADVSIPHVLHEENAFHTVKQEVRFIEIPAP